MYQEERSQAQPRQRQPQPTPQRGVEVLHGGIKWADAGESTFEEKSAKFAEAYRAARSKVLSSVPAAPTRTEPAPEEVSEDVAQAGQEAAGSESVNAMYEALARYRQSLNRNAEGQGQQAMPSAENSGQDDFSYQDSGYEEPQEPAYPGHPQEIQGREAHQGVPAEAYPQPSAQQAPAQQTVVQQQYAQEYYAQAQAAAQNFTPPPAAPTAEPPHHVEHAGMHAPQVAPEAHAPYDYGARQAAPGNRMEQNSEAAGVGQPAPQPEAQGYAQYQEQAYANQAEPTGESAYYGGFQQRAQQAEEAPQIRNEAVRERPEPAREPAAASRFSEPARQPVEQAYERAAEPERAVYQQQFEPVPQEQGGGTRQTAPEAVSADDKKSWKAGKLLSKIAKPSEQFETMEARPQAGKHAQAQPPLTPPAFPSETAAPYAGGSWVWQPGGADGGRSWIRRHPILFTGFILLALALAYNVGRYMSDSTPSGPKIAVVNLEGMILDSGKIVEWVEQVRKDDSYKGAVLRINSPGGAVGPSQEIFAAIRRLDQIKPVVASLGGVAASGGYYAALGAREIYSGPSTLTAGIGVKMQIPNVNGLMQTVGISEKTLSTGNLKDAGSAWRTMSPEEESYFYELLNDMYVEFMQTVSEQRKISMEDVQVLADGGAMTGRQALGAKLVDHLGDQHDALERLKVLCNMKPGDSFSLVEGPEQPSRKLKDFFLSLFEAGLEHKAAAEQPRFIY